LVANTTRLLVSRIAPQLATAPPPSRNRRGLFRDNAPADVPFSTQSLAPIVGALAIQTGLCGIWLWRPLPSAALVACGVAIWTWRSVARGALGRVKRTRSSHWLSEIVITLLLTIVLSTGEFQLQPATSGEKGAEPEILQTLSALWRQLWHPAEPKKPLGSNVAQLISPPKAAPKLPPGALKNNPPKEEIGASGSYFAPGVILRSGVRAQWTSRLYLPGGRGRNQNHAPPMSNLAFPFTGDYLVFPTSSARLKHDWADESGTLLEHRYATAGGGSLETEAYQRLDPPMELANCGKVHMMMVSAESAPFFVTLQLESDVDMVKLGTEVAGFDHHGAETLEFKVPLGTRSFPVKGMRAGFHRMPRQGSESMRVVVERFVIEPRGS
jgi:hypothetical protein